MFLKKLHIKILSLAFLVTLVSYNTTESRLLPQQFVSEYVVYENVLDNRASYSIFSAAKSYSYPGYNSFSFSDLLLNFNTNQKVYFTAASSNSDVLKQSRTLKSFYPLRVLYKDPHSSFI